MENFINLHQDATNLTGPTPGRFGPDRPEGWHNGCKANRMLKKH